MELKHLALSRVWLHSDRLQEPQCSVLSGSWRGGHLEGRAGVLASARLAGISHDGAGSGGTQSGPQSRAFAWLHVPRAQPHEDASGSSATAPRPGARCTRQAPRGSTQFAHPTAPRDWPVCAYVPSCPPDTTRATGTWGARCDSVRHRYAWLHNAISHNIKQASIAIYMATLCTLKRPTTTLQALQLKAPQQSKFRKRGKKLPSNTSGPQWLARYTISHTTIGCTVCSIHS